MEAFWYGLSVAAGVAVVYVVIAMPLCIGLWLLLRDRNDY